MRPAPWHGERDAFDEAAGAPNGAAVMGYLALEALRTQAYAQAKRRSVVRPAQGAIIVLAITRLLAPIGAALLVAACRASPAVSLADKSLMPSEVMMQSVRVQEAYRFAAAHPEHLETVPCYCGCVQIDHRSNLECYLKPESRPGTLVFDMHALGCEICADITHLTMDLLETGASPAAIRAAVDSQFAERGPGTITPHSAGPHAADDM